MKKIIATLAVTLVLTAITCVPALADNVISPVVTPNNNPPKTTDNSPKTSDINTLAYAGAGVICIGGAVFCATKARNAS